MREQENRAHCQNSLGGWCHPFRPLQYINTIFTYKSLPPIAIYRSSCSCDDHTLIAFLRRSYSHCAPLLRSSSQRTLHTTRQNKYETGRTPDDLEEALRYLKQRVDNLEKSVLLFGFLSLFMYSHSSSKHR